jgi:hypothetical protein
VIPEGVCVRCETRPTYSPRADYCAECARELRRTKQRAWNAQRSAKIAAGRMCRGCRSVLEADAVPTQRYCERCQVARAGHGLRCMDCRWGPLMSTFEARRRRCVDCWLEYVGPAAFCRDCGTPILGSLKGSPQRCIDCRIEAEGAPRTALPDDHPARAVPPWGDIDRTCANCGAAYRGRAHHCLACRAALILGGGHFTVPVRYCVDCGWSLGPPHPSGGGRLLKRCSRCTDVRGYVAGVDYMLERIRYLESWRVDMNALEWWPGPVASVDWWNARRVPAQRRRILPICARAGCSSTALFDIPYCYDDRLLHTDSRLTEEAIDHALGTPRAIVDAPSAASFLTCEGPGCVYSAIPPARPGAPVLCFRCRAEARAALEPVAELVPSVRLVLRDLA